jgi:hypothetical protein
MGLLYLLIIAVEKARINRIGVRVGKMGVCLHNNKTSLYTQHFVIVV